MRRSISVNQTRSIKYCFISKSTIKGHSRASQRTDEHKKLGPITSLTVNFNIFK